jgi:predicted CxxxxCH...CXXCH cytochrome family protein
MCHGGEDLANGAPPRATWGNGGDAVRTGAHTRHLTAGPVGPAAACSDCHVTPADAFTPGHVDGGTAEVVFARAPLGAMPAFDRSTGTCSGTYCHGGGLGGGTRTSPVWTRLGQGEADCGSCHGLPPPPPHPAVSGSLERCAVCHAETVTAAGALIPPAEGGRHLDGLVEASGGHPAAFSDPQSPEFHAFTANQGLASCRECHGAALDGAAAWAPGCTTCHGEGFATRCTSCHGGVELANGAPPRPTWGGEGDPRRVGAHTRHLAGGAVSRGVACGECHAVPADPFQPGHVDAAVQVAFGGPLGGAVGGSWNYPATGAPTCSSTYCHGNFLRGNVANTPSWTGVNQAACGSCHASRPLAYLHRRHERDYGTSGIPWWPLPGGAASVTCGDCHAGIARSEGRTSATALEVVDGAGPALHVDGKTDVVFRAGGTYERYSAEGFCSNMACHPGETKAWPR